jgi:GNAT superfamily N-acetyltransferase
MRQAVMSFALMRITAMPRDFADLRALAEREGYGFLRRLSERWNGESYLDDQLATVWGAVKAGALIAIGAQTYDEYDPSPLYRRIRHFYVEPEHRRGGVGRAVAAKLIEDAHALAPYLHLRATHALSAAFWDSVGFTRVEGREDRTHVLVRG